jgi:RND superfamily putative drug exporter
VQVAVVGGASASVADAGIERLRLALRRRPIFGPVTEETRNDDGTVTRLTVPIAGDSVGDRAIEAVRELRDVAVPRAFAGFDGEVLVTGDTARELDYQDTLDAWIAPVFAVVLGLSLVLLTIAFRSIVVPLKAIVLNLLSVGAAYGLLVLVFQEGVGNELLGVAQAENIAAWVPLFLFAVLFGLSMDYQVFLLSRIRERYLQTGDSDEAVAHGVGSTARLITGAALIIIAVFWGFAMGDLIMFQQMGLGVAAALLIDATIVRSVLLPASMKLLGRWNWYLPGWLSWLPDAHVEGASRPRATPRPAT